MSSTLLRCFYPQIFIPHFWACWTNGVYLVNDVKIKLSSDVTKHKLMAKTPLPWQQKRLECLYICSKAAGVAL